MKRNLILSVFYCCLLQFSIKAQVASDSTTLVFTRTTDGLRYVLRPSNHDAVKTMLARYNDIEFELKNAGSPFTGTGRGVICLVQTKIQLMLNDAVFLDNTAYKQVYPLLSEFTNELNQYFLTDNGNRVSNLQTMPMKHKKIKEVLLSLL